MCRRNTAAMNLFRPGGKQHAGALSGCCAGGNLIIQNQNPLAMQLLGTNRLIRTQHIGTALCLSRNAGLGTVMADFT